MGVCSIFVVKTKYKIEIEKQKQDLSLAQCDFDKEIKWEN